MNPNVRTGAYQGAEFVTFRARECAQGKFESIFITRLPDCISKPPTAKLKNSKFKSKSDLDAFTESFDKGMKITFSEDGKPQFVKFGSARDNDNNCDVKAGKLKLQGQAVSVCI